MKKILFILLITILMPWLQSCEKKGDPPVIPPPETMLIDFSNFINNTKSALQVEIPKGLPAVNNLYWSVAATVAGIWNTLLFINLAIPVAAFQKSFDAKPAYLDNKKWQWKYSVNVLAATYIARLTGHITSAGVKWEMYISREGVGGFAEFLWFEGTSSEDGKTGQWILYQSHTEQVPVLQIDWQITDTDVGSVKYTYIKEANPMKDSYIEYGLTTGDLNAFYNVYFYESESLKKFVNVQIKWSTTDHYGRIKAPDFFGDNSWHCWDGNGNDTDCTGE
ncbi:MAG: hypothetical protein ACUVTX_11140 [Bacteroidales bacterium]